MLKQLTDDLLANGDLQEALQRMLNRGWETPDGERVQGLRELLDELRMEREELLEQGDLGGAYAEIAEELAGRPARGASGHRATRVRRPRLG